MIERSDECGELRRLPAAGVRLLSIGTIYVGGEWDVALNVITAPAAVPGWHVCLRLVRQLATGEAAALVGIVVAPDPGSPYRVWA